MKSKLLNIIVAGFVLLLPALANAQVMRLEFNVESELFTEQLQELFFGDRLPMAGLISVPLGDPDMGIYRITGSANLILDVDVTTPGRLVHVNEEFADFFIPLELGFAYANREENNIEHAILFEGSLATYPITTLFDNTIVDPTQAIPLVNSYLYVFGSIEIGDIPQGIYEAEVVISIEYQ